MSLIQLSTSHILPFGPPALYVLLEAVALGIGLWIWDGLRTPLRWPDSGPGLGKGATDCHWRSDMAVPVLRGYSPI
jgi:hypothetical protein